MRRVDVRRAVSAARRLRMVLVVAVGSRRMNVLVRQKGIRKLGKR